VHELQERGMTTFTTAVDNFLDYPSPKFEGARAVGLATRNLDVYRTEKFRLVRVCSLTELRAAVALAGMAMAAYALDTCQAEFPDAVLDIESDLSDLVTLQHAVAQADSPQLIEGILAIRHAGQPYPVRRGVVYRHLWPKGTAKIAGYQGGVEGLVRLATGCWLEGRESIDTTEHGISSVFPRAKAAFKHLRANGATAVHEKRVLEILGALQVTNLLQFLESPLYTA
jgi:hypothetical protein